MTRLSKLGCALLAVVLVLGVTFGAFASDWPSKPITMVIGWSAGGGSDVTARLVFPYVEKILGQKIIIVNKPGAGGEISFSELARSKPDGYYFA
ncbi:MAG: tripartite tricarboxylate transporter substrate binding protein, partial [Firmicutes bacterium]|nr:tripartite tricarboxylate transporter substrate binding protein [Bacillota bacterium]